VRAPHLPPVGPARPGLRRCTRLATRCQLLPAGGDARAARTDRGQRGVRGAPCRPRRALGGRSRAPPRQAAVRGCAGQPRPSAPRDLGGDSALGRPPETGGSLLLAPCKSTRIPSAQGPARLTMPDLASGRARTRARARGHCSSPAPGPSVGDWPLGAWPSTGDRIAKAGVHVWDPECLADQTGMILAPAPPPRACPTLLPRADHIRPVSTPDLAAARTPTAY
jgi:hypothetical protein